jgi:cell division protein FtsI (penicillin-binding protein 3)
MTAIGIDILSAYRARRNTTNWRHVFVMAWVFPAFLFLILYTANLGLGGRRRTRAPADADAVPTRADIIDRFGEILAKNRHAFDLVLNARQIREKDRAAALVHSMFPDISVRSFLAKADSGGGYVELRKNITKDQAALVRRQKIDGLSAVPRQTREYPKHNSMSHVIGFVGRDGFGLEGLELLENDRLANDPAPLRISIDSRIQSIMWDALSSAVQEYGAKGAAGILMNARTGEVLAMVSLPDFDPDDIGAYGAANRRNRILRDNYEMGSIFKIFNTALALMSGMPADKRFNAADPFYVGGAPVNEARGFNPPDPKNISVAQIMQYSSNRGSAQIALSLPADAQMRFFRELHLGSAIETDFGKTAAVRLPVSATPTDRSRWAFGQGIATTPLHAFLAANAVANDGKYIMPTIFPRGFVPQTNQVAPRDVSYKIRQIMFMIGDTSGKLAARQIQGIEIGGKTSTAQKWDGKKYSDTKNITVFFTVFPIRAPKYSMMIMFDEPSVYPRTAAHNSVPTAGKILDAAIPLLPL